jgi:hypothetical protein
VTRYLGITAGEYIVVCIAIFASFLLLSTKLRISSQLHSAFGSFSAISPTLMHTNKDGQSASALQIWGASTMFLSLLEVLEVGHLFRLSAEKNMLYRLIKDAVKETMSQGNNKITSSAYHIHNLPWRASVPSPPELERVLMGSEACGRVFRRFACNMS